MPNWNSGYLYNAGPEENGFFWNGATHLLVINIHEVMKTYDEITYNLAKYILSEKINLFYASILETVFFDNPENLIAKDTSTTVTIFEIADSLGIKDEISNLLVLAYINDRQDIIDDVIAFTEILLEDKITIDEIPTIEALLEIMDNAGFEDLSKILGIVLNMYDSFALTDRDPKTAIADFMIGNTDEYDAAYDWLLPFGMMVDWATTTIQVMPEAELTTIEMPGIDGSIVEDSVYKDRLFQVVAFSQQGMTTPEKEEMKSKIAQILDETKRKSKKLTVQNRGVSFDVRYDGIANITEGPSYVKANIPFRASPYGYSQFENEVRGSGMVTNNGDAPTGTIHTIKGPITNPSFILGSISYLWKGTVEENSTLVIDHDFLTCYYIESNGKKKNALANLTGKFQKVPARSSIILNADSIDPDQIITTWRDKILW